MAGSRASPSPLLKLDKAKKRENFDLFRYFSFLIFFFPLFCWLKVSFDRNRDATERVEERAGCRECR